MQAATGKAYAKLDPVSIYEKGRYRTATTRLGASPSDEAAAYRATILNRVKDFWLYHRGRPVGVMHIRRTAVPTGCISHIMGFGDVTWTNRPDFRLGGHWEIGLDDRDEEVLSGAQREVRRVKGRELDFRATSPRLPTQDFSRGSGLNADTKKVIESIARTELRLAQARKVRGRSIQVVGDLTLRFSEVLDVDRDGTHEVVAQFDAPLRKPPDEPYDPVFSVLLVVRSASSGRPAVLLSVPTVFDPLRDEDGPYRFEAAMDVNGDGVAELLLSRPMGLEGVRRVVFELRSGRFIPVLNGPNVGC